MSERLEFDSNGRIKKFPGEPEWSQKLPVEPQEIELPDSIKAQIETIEALRKKILAGEVESFFVYTDNTDNSYTVYYTPCQDVFSTFGAIQAYAVRVLQGYLSANEKDQSNERD